MSETLWNRSLASFRDAIASTEPTPGGGSVSMVSATFGLGLVLMALEITAKKPEPGSEGALADLLAEGRRLLAELSAHADEDVAVFQRYMTALKLPKGTDAEKTARKQALQEALVGATHAPLNAARSCVAGIKLALKSVEQSNVRVVSDVGAGASLLGGAIAAVLLNVDINLPGIIDLTLRQDCALERARIEVEATSLATKVLEQVDSRIKAGK